MPMPPEHGLCWASLSTGTTMYEMTNGNILFFNVVLMLRIFRNIPSNHILRGDGPRKPHEGEATTCYLHDQAIAEQLFRHTLTINHLVWVASMWPLRLSCNFSNICLHLLFGRRLLSCRLGSLFLPRLGTKLSAQFRRDKTMDFENAGCLSGIGFCSLLILFGCEGLTVCIGIHCSSGDMVWGFVPIPQIIPVCTP